MSGLYAKDQFGRLRAVLFASQSSKSLVGVKVRTAFAESGFLQTGSFDEATFVISRVEMPLVLKGYGQMYNHIDGERVLTEKDRLLVLFRRYWQDRPSARVEPFMPRTYRTGVAEECDQLCDDVLRDQLEVVGEDPHRNQFRWVRKPGGVHGHNAQGIAVLTKRAMEQLVARNKTQLCLSPSPYLVQRYIARPFVMDGGRRVDLRLFMVIASVQPAWVLWHFGYGRIAHRPWAATADTTDGALALSSDQDNIDVARHLTNAAQVTGSQALRHYVGWSELTRALGRAGASWTDSLEPRIDQTVLASFQAARLHLDQKPGYFAVLGGDFVYSLADRQLYLLEWNAGPQFDNIAAADDDNWAVSLWRAVINITGAVRNEGPGAAPPEDRCAMHRQLAAKFNMNTVLDETCLNKQYTHL